MMKHILTTSLVLPLALLLTHCSNASFDSAQSQQGGDMAMASTSAGGTSNPGSVGVTQTGSVGLSQAGAQDFGLFRQILEDGDLPAPGTLDDLGFFAEHKIDYPEANCGEDVCVHALLGVTGNMITGSNCTLVQIGLNSPIDPNTLERPPLHLVLAVDVSGSMQGDAITYVKEGLDRMIDALQPEDRISLVTYSDAAEVVFRDVAGDDKVTLKEAFAGLIATGHTNLYDGMFTAFDVAQADSSVGWQNRVVLLSDGVATKGITSTGKMVSLAAAYAREGIGITTIGIGEDFDLEVMRSLAEVGAGNFYFLEDPAAVKEVFTDEVKTFLYPVATDVTIDVNVGGAYRIGRVYGTNGWSGDAHGGRIEIPTLFLAGRTDASAPIEEGRRGGGGAIVFELLPIPGGAEVADPYSVVSLNIDWTDPQSGAPLAEVFPVTNPSLPGVLADGGYFDDFTVEKGFVMVNVLVGFEMAAEFADDGDYPAARSILEAMRPALADWLADNPDPDLEDDLVYVDLFIQNLEDAEDELWVNLPPPAEPTEPWPMGD